MNSNSTITSSLCYVQYVPKSTVAKGLNIILRISYPSYPLAIKSDRNPPKLYTLYTLLDFSSTAMREKVSCLTHWSHVRTIQVSNERWMWDLYHSHACLHAAVTCASDM